MRITHYITGLPSSKKLLADGEANVITVSYENGIDVELFVDDGIGNTYKVALTHQELVAAVKAQNQ
jgi:hypothetical protein